MYYEKHDIIERNGQKILVINQGTLYGKPIRYLNGAIIPNKANIFDEAKDVYLIDYRPNKENDYKTIRVIGVIKYYIGEVKFDTELPTYHEEEELKPPRKGYEWKHDWWYSVKTGKRY